MNYQANYFAINGETNEIFLADNTQYTFNAFLQFIVENGIIGFILLLLTLYAIFKTNTLAENSYLNYTLKVSLFSISIFSFFSYPSAILPIKLIIVILLAGISNISINSNTKKLNLPNTYTKLLLGIIFISIANYGTHHLNKLDNSLKKWKLALKSYKYGDYKISVNEFAEAYPYLKANGNFLINYGKALSLNKNDIKAIKILDQAKDNINATIVETTLGDSYKNLKEYDKAELAYKNAANMIPSRFYPLYLLAKLYEESGQKEKAISTARIILEKEIKIPSTAIKEIKIEMKKLINKYGD